MIDEEIRIGHWVCGLDQDEVIMGWIEHGHAGEWFVRTPGGELTGPWTADELHWGSNNHD